MRKKEEPIYLACDFETTVYEGQTSTEVWSSAFVELFTDDVVVHGSIKETWEYFVKTIKTRKRSIVAYYHNLKFDGNFWLAFFENELKMEQATDEDMRFVSDKDMKNNTYKYMISEMGSWYTITVKVDGKYIRFRDSLKLLPFTLKVIGQSFKTKHQKLEMEYEGYRYANCPISPEEMEYIKNDVLVLKEGLEFMFLEGHNKLTIGSCCINEYKTSFGLNKFDSTFPNMYEYAIDKEKYGYDNCGDYILRSYFGGWCYVVEGKANKEYMHGETYDVNSLYPSMMSSESGNRYPVGEPHFWEGDIPEDALKNNRYYFVKFKCRFNLKPGYLPFIHIRGSYMYRANENLKTSDIYYQEDDEYDEWMLNSNNEWEKIRPTLTLTMVDFELMKEHYYLEDLQILSGCWFETQYGLFDDYMEKYKRIKQTTKGGMRTLAKLFLNNLYGRFAMSTNSSYKVASTKEDGTVTFVSVPEYEKKPGYIPIGSAITSYARNFTIRVAQMNYHGDDKPGFIYADTDSIHGDFSKEDVVGIKVDDSAFCCWKNESSWDYGLFARQKTYVEHIVQEDGKDIDEPYYNVKCAGMPPRCKNLFISSVTEDWKGNEDKYSEDELEFLRTKRTMADFKVGLKVPGKLLPKHIPGGVVLTKVDFEFRDK